MYIYIYICVCIYMYIYNIYWKLMGSSKTVEPNKVIKSMALALESESKV